MMRLLELAKDSKSQFGQDLFVAWALRFKQGGFFVEVGATDGVHLSNTFMLEKSLGWTGILVEPARRWHVALGTARSCAVDTRCAWSRSGDRLMFCEAQTADLSTISVFKDGDFRQAKQGLRMAAGARLPARAPGFFQVRRLVRRRERAGRSLILWRRSPASGQQGVVKLPQHRSAGKARIPRCSCRPAHGKPR